MAVVSPHVYLVTTNESILVPAPREPTFKDLVIMEFPDAPVMVRICEAESGCTPEAKNPTSSALGGFQILKGTWEQYKCVGSRIEASSTIACARKIYDKEGTTPWNSSKSVWSI